LESIPAYLTAGAVAVGLGGALLGDVLSTGDTAALGRRVTTALVAARAVAE
jgi:2-dehydro-3-deoxyphosphogluconate aldolase/(4S)-4-hydroxy-2-oxoglutarate aldolase